MGRVTITDVAQAAGVSPTAVSFAFNRPEQLSPATAARILEFARHLGYAPNPHARTLLWGRVGVVGVLVPQAIFSVLANPFFSCFLQGVGSICDENGLSLLVLSPLHGSLEEAIARAPVDGFIIVGLNEHHEEVLPLLRRGVPFVIVDGDSEMAPSVNAEDEAGAYSAGAHLLARGHGDLLILTFETPYGHLDDVHYGVGGRRLRGYQRALKDYGVTWREDWILSSLATIEGGEQSFSAAWDEGLRPTGVLAMSDCMAMGAVKAALRRGLAVPEELEVIGFDDVPVAELLKPALSTVRQPILEKGRLAAELLAAALEGQSAAENVHLPTELVLRETTRGAGESSGPRAASPGEVVAW